MNTVEASYVSTITLLVIAVLINGAVRLHGQVTEYAGAVLEEEISAHTKDHEKSFRPEEFIRSITLLETDPEDTGD